MTGAYASVRSAALTGSLRRLPVPEGTHEFSRPRRSCAPTLASTKVACRGLQSNTMDGEGHGTASKYRQLTGSRGISWLTIRFGPATVSLSPG